MKWTVEKHDTESLRYGKKCGTRVTSPDGRVVDFCGRMTKGDAIRRATLHWEREARINAHGDLMEGTPEEARKAIEFLDSFKSQVSA